LKEILEAGIKSHRLLAFQEAKRYFLEFEEERRKANIQLEENKYNMYIKYLGETFFYLGENDDALIYYNHLLKFGLQKNNNYYLGVAYRKIAEVYFKKENFEEARLYALQSLGFLEKTKFEKQVLYTKYLLFNVYSKNIKKYKDEIDYVYNNILENFEKCKLYNRLCNIYSIISVACDYIQDVDDKLDKCEKAVNLAKNTGNKYILSVLYQHKGQIYSLKGDIDKTFECYRQSEKLKLEINKKLELARLCNGMGYDYFILEQYEKSYEYYNRALNLLKEEKEYQEITLTIYNISLTLFFMMEYTLLIEYLEEELEFMKILNLTSIPYHSLYGIYSMLGYAYLKTNKSIKGLKYYSLIENSEFSYKNFDVIVANMFEAEVLFRSGKEQAIHKNYEEIMQANTLEPRAYYFPRVFYEYALMEKKMGNEERYRELIYKGMKWTDKLQYKYHHKLLLKEVESDQVYKYSKKSELKKNNISLIIEIAKQEKVLNQLHKKINEEIFFNNLQNILIRPAIKKADIVDSVFRLIKNNFFIDYMFYYDKKEKKIFQYVEENDIDVENLKDEMFWVQEEGIVKVRKDIGLGNIGYVDSMINIPIYSKAREKEGIVIFINKNKQFSFKNSDLRMLSIAVKQMSISLISFELGKELEEKNRKLVSILDKIQSIEKMVSIIYTAKNVKWVIEYILTLLTSEKVLNYKKGIYFSYDESENILQADTYAENLNIDEKSKIDEKIDIKISLEEKNIICKIFDKQSIYFGEEEEKICFVNGTILKCFDIIPISYKENKYGVLVMERNECRAIFQEEKIRILKIFMQNMAIYLENIKLEKKLMKNVKLETMVKLSGSIVHEIRTPLIGIKGFAKIAKDKFNDGKKIDFYLDNVIKNANRVDLMASELLEYVEDNEYELERINLKDIIEKIIMKYRSELEINSIKIQSTINKNIFIKGSKLKSMMAIENIVKNSIEASKLEGAKIDIYVEDASEYIKLIIKDNGNGIRQDIIDNIFEPLITTKVQGTGLGLSIVKNIMQKHKGDVKLMSDGETYTLAELSFLKES
jgi:signal transduction histidine kinase